MGNKNLKFALYICTTVMGNNSYTKHQYINWHISVKTYEPKKDGIGSDIEESSVNW